MEYLVRRIAPTSILLACTLGPFPLEPLAAQSDSSSREMAAMRQYIGVWRAEDQQTQDGRTFHFVYQLEWFDPGESIAEMLITQHFEDGEERILWKGFKGWHPGTRAAYYHGFSPGGRAAAGHMRLDGDSFVTEYDGWNPSSAGVRIRDIFSPVAGETFTARTLVRTAPDQDWREVSTDVWTRIETSS